MPKGAEVSNAASAETSAPTPAKSPEATRSTSSAKYRVSSRPNIQSPTEAVDAARFSSSNVSSMLQRMNRKSSSQLSLSGPSEETSTNLTSGKPRNRFADLVTPSKSTGNPPKLPQKLRQHVTRLRTQFASGSGESSRNLSVGGRSPSPHKASRPSLSSASFGSKHFSSAAAAAVQHSRRSTQLLKPNTSKEKPEIEEFKPSQDPEPVVSAGTFQGLLRPLQTSLSCASLTTGWSSDEDDEAEQLFRQSERENSRMLRICCSIDNLMLSIGDRAQEQKQTEAIVRGATRDLLKLYQFALKQVVAVVFDTAESHSGNNNSPRDEKRAVKMDGKEAQYAMEFLLEINDRIGKLYEFARSVFMSEVDELRSRMTGLEEEVAAGKLKNQQLQNEMRDIQDFHEQNNVSAVNVFTIGNSGSRHAVLDNENDTAAMAALTFTEIAAESGEDECSALRQQCQELSRLLEMAKQEIRLCHHERDVQKAHVAEISSALFHDSELGFLRNQLQSEKKRVRILERENLTLRESQQEQSLKIQSLEELQTSNSAAPTNTTLRPSIELHNESVEEEPAVPTTHLTLETEDNEYNFIHSVHGGAAPTVTLINWFSRIVNPPQLINVRKSRKKRTDVKPEQQPPVVLSKFLADLLMKNKQLVTAKEESKARRQGNVPTLGPPPETTSNSRKVGGRNRRPRSASNVGGEDSHEEIITGCLQLVWAFYQRFLLAAEAQSLLGTRGIGGDPMLGSGGISSAGSPATEPVSLPHIIFHFFLERCSHEREAVHELETFVRCVHGVRSDSYSLELFCQFSEETCSRQELCFFLWVCQAMDDVRLGIPYDDPLPSYHEGLYDDEPTQFVCVLKATFLARTIFRILHFKVLCRPMSKDGRRRGKGKQSPQKKQINNPAVPVTPSSPSTSPKRKPRTRLGEITAALAASADPLPAGNNVDLGQDEPGKLPLHVAAQTELREFIANNHDQPITLETFNNLLLKFAIVPSSEELAARLGPFYRPTGDERKIPTDVFLALLMEVYKFQLQWQRDQLRALFIHLNHQEDVQQRAVEKLSRRQRDDERKPPTSRVKRHKSRDGTADNGVKYLRGLSRRVLRELLLQAGIVHDGDMAQVDMDWLFAQLLEAAGGSAADITFDAVFNALHKMKWLDSTKLRVDSLVETTGGANGSLTKRNIGNEQQTGAKRYSKSPISAVPSPIVRAVRDKWRVFARHSVALCNNDPNVFIRRHSQRLQHYVDQHLVNFATESEGGGTSTEFIPCIREFLAFAWTVAAKRCGKGATPVSQSCLTEVFMVCQALRATFDPFPGYQSPLGEPQAPEGQDNSKLLSSRSGITQDALQSFYSTARMNLTHFIKAKDPATIAVQLDELEHVLMLYATHIAHLFHRFSEARFNCSPHVSFHRWASMVYELGLVHPHKLSLPYLRTLFERVVSSGTPITASSLDHEIGVGKTHFSELFVLVAVERHRVAVSQKLEKTIKKSPGSSQADATAVLEASELADRPARIMATFCREVLAARAFGGETELVERNFAAKLACPLVGRALLEHRAFLRCVFFYYAKQDEIAAEQQLVRENGPAEAPPSDFSAALLPNFQLEKTKRSSMSFGEFQAFLAAFGLLEPTVDCFWSGAKVALADAHQVFSKVVALDNDDTLQLEFDEFAAAIVALAVHLDPSPFTLWHEKLHHFASQLQRRWEEPSETTG